MIQVISTFRQLLRRAQHIGSMQVFEAVRNLAFDQRGDDYGEKAVILVLVVLGGVAAFAAFGGKIVELITQATGGI